MTVESSKPVDIKVPNPKSLTLQMIQYHGRSLQVALAVALETGKDGGFRAPNAEEVMGHFHLSPRDIETAVARGFVITDGRQPARYALTEIGKNGLIFKLGIDLERINSQAKHVQRALVYTARAGTTFHD